MQLKDSRTVQFAVGCTVILLAVRWLLTGDLLMLVQAAQPTEDGKTSSVGFAAVVWPMVTDAVVLVGISAIAFALKIWSVIYRLIESVLGTAGGGAPAPASLNTDQQQRELVLDLARAARAGDRERVMTLASQLRTPEAIAADIIEAAKASDVAAVERLTKELSGHSFMLAQATKRGKAAANE